MPQDINTELAVSGAIKDSTNTKVRHDIKTMETVEKERPMQDIGRSNKRSLSEIVADSDESDFGSDQA